MSALEDALAYEAFGWSVIPAHSIGLDGFCTCPKTGCLSPGKHPRLASWTRYQQERATAQQVREWWAQWPSANVAIVTGKISGIVVVDVDDYHGGDDSERLMNLPETVTCLTGGGGKHYYYAHPGGLVRNRTGILPGIDLRGDGGYVIAPPSNHERGVYRWAITYEPGEFPIAAFPDSINTRDPVQEAAAPDFDAQLEKWMVSGLAEGQRNTGLTRIAGHFFGRGATQIEALERTLGMNAMLCQAPLSVDEVKTIVNSIYERENKKRLQQDRMRALAAQEASLLSPDQRLEHARTAWEELGIEGVADWYVAVSVEGVEYTLELSDRTVLLGDNLLSFTQTRNLLANGTKVVIPRMKAAAWDSWVQRLVFLAREEITGAMSITEQVKEWTDAYSVNIKDVPPDTRRDVLQYSPILADGHTELTASGFQRFVEAQFSQKLAPREVGLRLRQGGWLRQTVNRGEEILAVWQKERR